MQAIGRVGWQLALAGGSTVLFACLLALDGATSILAFAFVACACTAEGISPEQAVDEAIARIKLMLAE